MDAQTISRISRYSRSTTLLWNCSDECSNCKLLLSLCIISDIQFYFSSLTFSVRHSLIFYWFLNVHVLVSEYFYIIEYWYIVFTNSSSIRFDYPSAVAVKFDKSVFFQICNPLPVLTLPSSIGSVLDMIVDGYVAYILPSQFMESYAVRPISFRQ